MAFLGAFAHQPCLGSPSTRPAPRVLPFAPRAEGRGQKVKQKKPPSQRGFPNPSFPFPVWPMLTNSRGPCRWREARQSGFPQNIVLQTVGRPFLCKIPSLLSFSLCPPGGLLRRADGAAAAAAATHDGVFSGAKTCHLSHSAPVSQRCRSAWDS
jgi:hypothetical protein